MQINRTVRAASRHVLLAELLLGAMLVAWGASKGVDARPAGMGALSFATGWILPTLIGALQFIAAAIEWCSPQRAAPVCGFQLDGEKLTRSQWLRRRIVAKFRRPWGYKELQRHVAVRGWLAGFGALMWAYELKEFVLDPQVLAATFLILVAPMFVLVNLYSAYANRKVWIALNPDIATSTLNFDRS